MEEISFLYFFLSALFLFRVSLRVWFLKKLLLWGGYFLHFSRYSFVFPFTIFHRAVHFFPRHRLRRTPYSRPQQDDRWRSREEHTGNKKSRNSKYEKKKTVVENERRMRAEETFKDRFTLQSIDCSIL